MNSNDLNDPRSRSSSSGSSTEALSTRCAKASAQFRHQMQGGINSGHQGHRQTSLTAHNNQSTNSTAHNSEVNSSLGRSNLSVTSNGPQASGESQVLSSDSSTQNYNPSLPTSASCNAITTGASDNSGSSNSSSSSLSSSTSPSLASLVLQQQQAYSRYAQSSNTDQIQSIWPSIRSSVHSSTPTVSLSHPSQASLQPSTQYFSSSPSLVQTTYAIGAINRVNACQFVSSNISKNHPSITSSTATVVTTISASHNGASAHYNQAKQENPTSGIVNNINASVDASLVMSGQSNVSASQISDVKSGRDIPVAECALTRNHTETTRNAIHQPTQSPHGENSSAISSLNSEQAHDSSCTVAAGTLQCGEVSSTGDAHPVDSKQSCEWSKGSHGATNDTSSTNTRTETMKDSTSDDSSSSGSSSGTPVTIPATGWMPPNTAMQLKLGKSSAVASTALTTNTPTSTNSPSPHVDKTTSVADTTGSSTPDDPLEYCWQSRMPSVKERLRAILNKETLADVYFLVGQTGKSVKFPAHKFVLSVGSPVFDAMFNGKFVCDERDPIELPDCEPCAFLALLTFLYTDEVTVDANSVMSTLYISKKYDVSELEKQCVEFLRRHLAPNNSIVLLSQARLFDETDLAQNCLEFIDKSTVESLNSEGFTEIDRDTLSAILERDSLAIPEVSLWKCVLSWARAECKRQDLDSSRPEILRSILGPVLNLIRFPLMSIEEFASEVAQTGVLVDRQIIDMFLYFTVNPKPQLSFSCESRGQSSGKERVVQRFQKVESRWGYSGTSDRIKFQANRRIFLVGFGLFGAIHGSSEYDVAMQLLLPSGEVLATNETCFTCDGSTQTFRVNFKEPVEIHPNVSHTACVTMKGVDSYYGAQGKKVVSIEAENKSKITFTFNYSSGCNNGTSVEDGQIPELYFHT